MTGYLFSSAQYRMELRAVLDSIQVVAALTLLNSSYLTYLTKLDLLDLTLFLSRQHGLARLNPGEQALLPELSLLT
jgi:hypothetical protein